MLQDYWANCAHAQHAGECVRVLARQKIEPFTVMLCRIGYLEQEPQLDAGETVAENIAPAVQHVK